MGPSQIRWRRRFVQGKPQRGERKEKNTTVGAADVLADKISNFFVKYSKVYLFVLLFLLVRLRLLLALLLPLLLLPLILLLLYCFISCLLPTPPKRWRQITGCWILCFSSFSKLALESCRYALWWFQSKEPF